MHFEVFVALAGLLVGFTVGLTGMGGGALMTPILVLLFKVQPLAAVSSDLVAAVVMKPIGGAVHLRRGTVNRQLVKWLALGSVPAAFLGVLVLRLIGGGSDTIQSRLKLALGVTLLVASGTMIVKAYMQARRVRREAVEAHRRGPIDPAPFRLKKWVTVLIGFAGGLVVGMTSVGSGSIIIIALMLTYPALSTRELVGTDLVQAIPLVTAAAAGHLLFGDFQLGLTTSVLLGSVPGVYLGARVSARARDTLIRPALVFVLLASGLKLVNVSTPLLGGVLLAFTLVAVPIWGVLDAAARPKHHWEAAGLSKRMWIGVQAFGAPFGIGFWAALAYFFSMKRRLQRGGIYSDVAVAGDELNP
jgi:uncharacterized protein